MEIMITLGILRRSIKNGLFDYERGHSYVCTMHTVRCEDQVYDLDIIVFISASELSNSHLYIHFF